MRPIADCIIHADTELVVVDKPPGLISGGPDRQFDGEPLPRQSVESLLVRHLGRRLWAVHQLDRNTSGLNCFVLKASLVAAWSERLKVPGTKRYLALVHGAPKVSQITVDLSLGERVAASGKTFPAVMPMIDPTARPARSHVRFLASNASFALAEVITETGRTHQVRLHLAAIGHPLVGEHLHRDPPCALHPRHALHAARLDFRATSTRPALCIDAPVPADLIELARRLDLQSPADFT